MKYTFHIVDVFSSTPFGGNQLAVLPDAAGISTEGIDSQHVTTTRGAFHHGLPRPTRMCERSSTEHSGQVRLIRLLAE